MRVKRIIPANFKFKFIFKYLLIGSGFNVLKIGHPSSKNGSNLNHLTKSFLDDFRVDIKLSEHFGTTHVFIIFPNSL